MPLDIECCYSECRHAECRDLFIIMLNVVILSVVSRVKVISPSPKDKVYVNHYAGEQGKPAINIST
jgi:hypothetical protein